MRLLIKQKKYALHSSKHTNKPERSNLFTLSTPVSKKSNKPKIPLLKHLFIDNLGEGGEGLVVVLLVEGLNCFEGEFVVLGALVGNFDGA